jgi:NitT/TauT family transport system substrate-binding protein
MRSWKKVSLIAVITVILGLATVKAQSHKLVFAPQWMPQAQFAGYYVAEEQGYYRDAGLEVEIVHPSASIQATALLTSGKADLISLFLVTSMSVRIKGVDIVNAGQISQHSTLLFVTKKARGITQLNQLNGKRIGVWKSGFDEVPKALMASKNIQIEWVPILSTVSLFMMDGIDAMTVMSYNEYDQIINSGMDEDELNVFPLAEYGFDVPEDGLYCLRKTYLEKGADLGKFLEATLKGWDYAAANRKYAVDVVISRMQQAHISANRAHQQWMLDKVIDMITPGTKEVEKGVLLESDFIKAQNVLSINIKDVSGFSYADFYKPVLK